MDFSTAVTNRHACKIFDEDKIISLEDKRAIIEFGRMSPSSFGFEPWHFLVISNKELRERLRPACWDQVQITSASFIVIFLTYLPYNFKSDVQFFEQRARRRVPDDERFAAFKARVMNFLAEQNTQEWAKRQAYIALANMLTGAATLGIDSCPMEGFDSQKLKKVLADNVDWSIYDPTVIAAFGYRLKEPPQHIREQTDSVATFIE